MTESKLNLVECEENAEIVYKGPKYGVRHTQWLLMLGLVTIGYTMRVNLSVAVVAMTDKSSSVNPDIPVYDWKNTGTILSSFFWGYICLQIFAGNWATTYGAKWFLAATMTLNSVASMAVPLMAAHFGSNGVLVCRVIQGLSQGFFYPSCHALLGNWAPAPERSRAAMLVFSGAPLGTIIGLPVTSAFSASWIGWPPSFYFFGSLGLVWVLFWVILGSNKPSEHKNISADERYFIESTLGHAEGKAEVPTPWKSILTSWPVWAIVVANFGQNWGYATLLTNIPSYLNYIMKFDMKSNGLLSAAPYMASASLCPIVGAVSDYLINHGVFSRTSTRKIMNSIGTLIPAISLTALGFVSEDMPYLSVSLLIVTVGINAGVFCGFQVNHIDLSPNHSGTLMGIANGSSNIFSIISPLVVDAIVTDKENKSQWRLVFIIASLIYAASNVFYMIFASGDLQEWNEEQNSDKDKVTKN